MNNAIVKVLGRAIKKNAFKIKKHAPQILMVTGIACGIGCTVTACNATLKAKDILEDAKMDIDAIHAANTDPNVSDEEYTDDAMKRELTRVYAQTGFKLAKLYAPAVILGLGSIAGTVGSSMIMTKRVNTAVAAYTALDATFRQYRDRVKEALGANEELDVYHGIKRDEETGDILLRPAECDSDRPSVKIDGYSVYARCFDEYNPNWKDNAEYNLTFLRGVQHTVNSMLEYQGFLFLNDVYKELGFEPTQAGQLVGWIYDPDRKDVGDNCVSFGLYDPKRGPALGEFINGNEKSVFLDFNVDGVIIDRI